MGCPNFESKNCAMIIIKISSNRNKMFPISDRFSFIVFARGKAKISHVIVLFSPDVSEIWQFYDQVLPGIS